MSGTVVQYFDDSTQKPISVTADKPLPVSILPTPNSIGTDNIKDGSITSEKFASDAKAPFAGKADESDAVAWDGVTGKPTDYPPSAHTHPIAQVDGLQDALDGKLSEIADNSVTTVKIADKAVTQEKLADALVSYIADGKFTRLSGSRNDANKIKSNGVYLNNGGYGLKNAPRDRYGWMLIVSCGGSNSSLQGAQLYLDVDGFDYRGFKGNTFTKWETFIIKDKVADVEPIADPSTVTAEDIANAYNALLAALKG